MEFDPKRYEPVKHNALSRAGHALGEGAQSGFWSGLKSGGVAALIAPVAAAGFAVYSGWGAIGIGLAALAGIGVSAVALPLIAGVAVIGTGVGLLTGAKRGNERTGKEHMAARYVDGYEGQMASMQNDVMAAMQRAQEAQRPIIVQQPPAAPAPQAAAPRAHSSHMAADVPSTKIDANALQYDNRVAGADLAMAR